MMQPLAVITTATHNFSVDKLTPGIRQLCGEFSRPLISYRFRTERGRTIREADKVFAAADASRAYYRFHISMLEEFLVFLEQRGIHRKLLSIVPAPAYTPMACELPLKPGWVPKEDQVDHIKYLIESKNPIRLLTRQTGTGKAQPVDTPTLTPQGWKKMGELVVGDEIITRKGTPSKIEAVFPQGALQVFVMKFADGRETKCCADHLWNVYHVGVSEKRVMRTIDIQRLLREDDRLEIDLCQPVEAITEQHPLFADRVSLLYELEMAIENPNFVYTSEEETDPDQLRNLRIEQAVQVMTPAERRVRIAKLLGMKLDEAANNGKYWLRLPKHVVDLLARLCWASGLYARKVANGWVEIDPWAVFPDSTRSIQRIKIESVVSTEDIAEMVCISIEDAESLYLTNDYIVTHNTFCAMAACAAIGQRIVIVVKPMYMKKWNSDVKSILAVKDEDVLMVAGTDELKHLLRLEMNGELHDKVIIVSITTLQLWITDVEDNGPKTLEDGYVCYPWQFFEVLRTGVRIVDETHQHFHQMFKLDLYSNVPASIALSATLISKVPLIVKMYDVMFPPSIRTFELPLNRYINTVAVHYHFEKVDLIRTTERGSKNYSHSAFEKSIMAHVPTMLNYFRLIKSFVDSGYILHPRKQKRLAIFAASIDMCTRLTAYLNTHYPHLDIRRYCDGDPYANVIEADIRVTTIGSCGTAIDIPDLVTVIQTHNISSIQANIQALGRLRELKGSPEETAVTYYFLTAVGVLKHEQYYKERRELFKERAKTFKDVYAGMNV